MNITSRFKKLFIKIHFKGAMTMKNKIYKVFGYRFSPEEKKKMNDIIKKYKIVTKKTTSQMIIEMFNDMNRKLNKQIEQHRKVEE